MPHTAGSRRGPSRSIAGVLAVRERTGCADMRCGHDDDVVLLLRRSALWHVRLASILTLSAAPGDEAVRVLCY